MEWGKAGLGRDQQKADLNLYKQVHEEGSRNRMILSSLYWARRVAYEENKLLYLAGQTPELPMRKVLDWEC